MADTILLTGISGFIAKQIAVALLNAGHAVRGSLRRPDRAAEVRAAVEPHLAGIEAIRRLSFVTAELDSTQGWPAAMAGVAAVVHTASPFPIVQPRDPQALIRPAVEGTRRVLRAAAEAGVGRLVLTSSTAAILDRRRDRIATEDDWADPDPAVSTPYAASKTLAERAAWEVAQARGLALTVINPGLVLGPPLDRQFGSSVGLVRRILAGRDPMVPRFGLPVVDVRDVARAHLAALQRPETAGRRYICAAGSLWMAEMGRTLKAAYPDRRIPTREAPDLLMRLLGLFDREVRTVLPQLGHLDRVANDRARAELGLDFITPEAALRATADWLVRHRAV